MNHDDIYYRFSESTQSDIRDPEGQVIYTVVEISRLKCYEFATP